VYKCQQFERKKIIVTDESKGIEESALENTINDTSSLTQNSPLLPQMSPFSTKTARFLPETLFPGQMKNEDSTITTQFGIIGPP